jgi:hypothetical protein
MPLMTRQQLLEHLNKSGYPIGESTLDKLCMPSNGGGPPVRVWWGKRALYDSDEAIKWAEGRCRPATPSQQKGWVS